jgi:UPF0755 protein
MPRKIKETSKSKIVFACRNTADCLAAAALEADASLKGLAIRCKKKFIKFKHWRIVGLCAAALFLWGLGMYGAILSAPSDFPRGAVLRVKKGSSAAEVAKFLSDRRVIRHALLFKVLARINGDGKIAAGDYRFEKPAGLFNIFERLSRGVYGIDPVRVTILEGHNAREIASLLDKSLPTFERGLFLLAADTNEGTLFPDTYEIKPMDDEQDIVNMMTANFDRQLLPLERAISTSGHTRDEIITMASIIELEARTPESRRMVSGILWSRIKKGMKLQVDAVFPFIMNKYSLNLTVKDLQYDSPYNTYRYKGLPPGPIGNPGLEAIRAALEPTKSNYLYYLSGRDGTMHYAKTYAGHMENRNKYLAGS